MKRLKPGSFVLIEGVPCRVERISISKPGKHGAVKVRIEAMGLLDDRRRSLVKPGDEVIGVPIITKRTAQVLALIGERAQLMDLTDYSVFELSIPPEKMGKLKAGEETAYYQVMGRRTLKEIKG
jgi:translation initiation factor 5A